MLLVDVQIAFVKKFNLVYGKSHKFSRKPTASNYGHCLLEGAIMNYLGWFTSIKQEYMASTVDFGKEKLKNCLCIW